MAREELGGALGLRAGLGLEGVETLRSADLDPDLDLDLEGTRFACYLLAACLRLPTASAFRARAAITS